MARRYSPLSLAMTVLSVGLLGPLAFTISSAPSPMAGHGEVAGVANAAKSFSSAFETTAKLAIGSGVTSCTIIVLASAAGLGAAAHRRRAARTSRGALISYDEKGRARFDTETAPTAGGDRLINYDEKGRARFATQQSVSLAVGQTGAIVVDGTFNPVVLQQTGITAPFGVPGQAYWDPAGLSNGISAEQFRQYRTAELKHGRVAMLAVAGLVGQHYSRFNVGDFDQVSSNGVAALSESPAGSGLALFIFLIGFLELNISDEGRAPGDYGDPLSFAEASGIRTPQIRWSSSLGDDLTEFRNFELNHGRLAMWGFLIAVIQEYNSGFDAVDQWTRVYPHLEITYRPLAFSLASATP